MSRVFSYSWGTTSNCGSGVPTQSWHYSSNGSGAPTQTWYYSSNGTQTQVNRTTTSYNTMSYNDYYSQMLGAQQPNNFQSWNNTGCQKTETVQYSTTPTGQTETTKVVLRQSKTTTKRPRPKSAVSFDDLYKEMVSQKEEFKTKIRDKTEEKTAPPPKVRTGVRQDSDLFAKTVNYWKNMEKATQVFKSQIKPKEDKPIQPARKLSRSQSEGSSSSDDEEQKTKATEVKQSVTPNKETQAKNEEAKNELEDLKDKAHATKFVSAVSFWKTMDTASRAFTTRSNSNKEQTPKIEEKQIFKRDNEDKQNDKDQAESPQRPNDFLRERRPQQTRRPLSEYWNIPRRSSTDEEKGSSGSESSSSESEKEEKHESSDEKPVASDSSSDESDVPRTPEEQFQWEAMDAHNRYRAVHGVPPLKLNKQICSYSQEWANYLAQTESFNHRQDRKYGENLYMSFGQAVDGSTAVTNWYDEIKDYTFGRDPWNFSQTGHFTQVVWKNTEEFGIALAKSRRGSVYVVANYSPAGNYMGQHAQNVFPPQR